MRARTLLELGAVVLAVLLLGLAYVPRAYLNLDDHRFLRTLQAAEAGELGGVRPLLLVENRWDGSWWIEDGTFVRFFRPLNAPSYALDRALWGLDARGYVATNFALHAAASVLAFLLLRRLVGGRVAPLVGALAFALHACHAEQLHFVPGRQGAMAGVASLATILAYVASPAGTRRRPALVGALFFVALCTKEWALVLPLVLVALERFVPRGDGEPRTLRAILSGERATWIACAAALALYLALRHVALGPGGSGARPFPYFWLPGRAGFVEHVLAVAAQYAAALAVGSPVQPFLADVATLRLQHGALELAAGAFGVPALCLWGSCRPAGRWLVAVLVLALVPLLVVYSSGRYLYLPSFAWCGLLALLARELPSLRGGAQRVAAAVVLAALVVVPSVRHGEVLGSLPTSEPRRPTQPERIVALAREAGLLEDTARPLYLVDFPGYWLETQFLPHVAAVELGREPRPVAVLTQLPWERAPFANVRRVAPDALEIDREGAPLHIGDPGLDFDQRVVQPGERIEEDGYRVEVLAAEAGVATRIRVTFDRPLEEVDLARGVYRRAAEEWGLAPLRL